MHWISRAVKPTVSQFVTFDIERIYIECNTTSDNLLSRTSLKRNYRRMRSFLQLHHNLPRCLLKSCRTFPSTVESVSSYSPSMFTSAIDVVFSNIPSILEHKHGNYSASVLSVVTPKYMCVRVIFSITVCSCL